MALDKYISDGAHVDLVSGAPFSFERQAMLTPESDNEPVRPAARGVRTRPVRDTFGNKTISLDQIVLAPAGKADKGSSLDPTIDTVSKFGFPTDDFEGMTEDEMRGVLRKIIRRL